MIEGRRWALPSLLLAVVLRSSRLTGQKLASACRSSQAHRDAGKRRGAVGFGAANVRAGVTDRFVARTRVNLNRDQVAHRSRWHEDARCHAMPRRAALRRARTAQSWSAVRSLLVTDHGGRQRGAPGGRGARLGMSLSRSIIDRVRPSSVAPAAGRRCGRSRCRAVRRSACRCKNPSSRSSRGGSRCRGRWRG